MNYSISDFWKKNFASVKHQSSVQHLDGWALDCTSDDSYVPADLSLRPDFSDLTQRIWLVAAPGAVGKSTLAREICSATGAVYLDLASAATVAGNYMVGGLVHTNLLQAWQAGQTTVLIDALDEARLRVTQSSFEDFLTDVARVALSGSFPLVLFGRVGIIEEAWTILNERANLNPAIFDIELFDDVRAEQFVLARLGKIARTSNPALAGALETHRSVYENAIRKIIGRLKVASAQDGDRFVGYAPVLDAVAKVIAGESNPARVDDATQRVLEGKILDRLAIEIMERESGKLVDQVRISIASLDTGSLYGVEEQLERLASKLFGITPPAVPTALPQHAIAAYEQAVATLLPQHPFLNGAATAPSSAVFGACIVAHALRADRTDVVKAAENYACLGHHAPNPFLFDFYRNASAERAEVPAEHVGLLYESVLAKAEPGDISRLSVDGAQGDDLIEVEITVSRSNKSELRAEFQSRNSGSLRLGRKVMGVSVDAETMDVELGTGGQLELVSPIAINARTLVLNCSEIVAKSEGHGSDNNSVLLEAHDLVAEPGLLPPTVRPGVQLQVMWPGSKAYPWTSFSFEGVEEEDASTAEALRALRRLVMSFRSHSKGRLARYRGKIEHARMIKGTVGEAVLQRLLADDILTLEGPMYFLEPNTLGAKVGVSFLDVQLKRYSPKARAYVQALE